MTSFDLASQYKNELNEAWGKGDRFGFVQIAPHKVYWYALKSFKKSPEELQIEDIEHYFDKYSPLIKDIIRSTKKSNIHRAEIEDLTPMNKWYSENICLLGDAAHATTPNMGQGACQAIEDAYVLSECLDKLPVNEAFKQYNSLRLQKAKRVVNTSWTLGKMAHLSNPLLVSLRNISMQMTPQFLNRKQSEYIFELVKL